MRDKASVLREHSYYSTGDIVRHGHQNPLGTEAGGFYFKIKISTEFYSDPILSFEERLTSTKLLPFGGFRPSGKPPIQFNLSNPNFRITITIGLEN